MDKIIFNPSNTMSIGAEVELQLINLTNFDLSDQSEVIVQQVNDRQRVKQELTTSMIELNSSPQLSAVSIFQELVQLVEKVRATAITYDTELCGGGRHYSSDWKDMSITDKKRYQNIAAYFGYLSKAGCVFGQHIHIGVKTGDDAIYLCHALRQYIPHFIALSASSPYYREEDTQFSSSRFSSLESMPNYGSFEEIYSWHEFEDFFHKVTSSGAINSIKDLYWDIRPQPQFGTIEIRVCDTPLHLYHAAMLAGYAHVIVRMLLQQKNTVTGDYRAIYAANKFRANRYGLDAEIINNNTFETVILSENILHTIERLRTMSLSTDETHVVNYIHKYVLNGISDADIIRKMIDSGYDKQRLVSQCIKKLTHVQDENMLSFS